MGICAPESHFEEGEGKGAWWQWLPFRTVERDSKVLLRKGQLAGHAPGEISPWTSWKCHLSERTGAANLARKEYTGILICPNQNFSYSDLPKSESWTLLPQVKASLAFQIRINFYLKKRQSLPCLEAEYQKSDLGKSDFLLFWFAQIRILDSSSLSRASHINRNWIYVLTLYINLSHLTLINLFQKFYKSLLQILNVPLLGISHFPAPVRMFIRYLRIISQQNFFFNGQGNFV